MIENNNAAEIFKNKYTISELSNFLGITDYTLRFYEKTFLLNVPRDGKGRRYYDANLANIMYKIKNMREHGLETKAIKKVIEDEESTILPSPVDLPESMEVKPLFTAVSVKKITSEIIISAINELSRDISEKFRQELFTSREELKEEFKNELQKTKLEIGACVENSSRRLESKLERHFLHIDGSLSAWRYRNRNSFFKKFLNGIMFHAKKQ